MKKFLGITILSIFIFGLFVFLPKVVFAEDPPPATPPVETEGMPLPPEETEIEDSSSGTIPLPEKPSNLPTSISMKDTIEKAFNIIVSVGEVAFIIMLLVGGVMYIVSGGDEAKGEKSKKLILNAVVGIVILLSAWAIATWVLTTLGAG